MTKRLVVVGSIAIMSVALVVYGQSTASPQRQTPTSASSPATASGISPQQAVINQYCITCHNQRAKAARLLQGRLVLEGMDLAHVGENAELWEKVVRKVRAGMMPPAGSRRPDAAALEATVVWLENELDRTAAWHLPPPGIHRLNRTEYANAIGDLLALDIDATKFLPVDDSTRGFDNIAGALGMSPALLEAYISAASKISRIAIGSVKAPTQNVYRVPEESRSSRPITRPART